mmetsp:Transcript_35089/g.87396  ORF Transcript_35089/g.87396 Transcript_35089/m.87396 type:complete len:235 (-) Transcript_35089:1953-2657(-)
MLVPENGWRFRNACIPRAQAELDSHVCFRITHSTKQSLDSLAYSTWCGVLLDHLLCPRARASRCIISAGKNSLAHSVDDSLNVVIRHRRLVWVLSRIELRLVQNFAEVRELHSSRLVLHLVRIKLVIADDRPAQTLESRSDFSDGLLGLGPCSLPEQIGAAVCHFGCLFTHFCDQFLHIRDLQLVRDRGQPQLAAPLVQEEEHDDWPVTQDGQPDDVQRILALGVPRLKSEDFG